MKKIILFVIFLFLVNFANAAVINIIPELDQDKGEINFSGWVEYNKIDQHGNLHTEIGISFYFDKLNKDSLENSENFTIYVGPKFWLHKHLELKSIGFGICESRMPITNNSTVYLDCDKGFLDYSSYNSTNGIAYKIPAKQLKKDIRYSIEMNYTIPNFVVKQGKYNILWFLDQTGKNRDGSPLKYVYLPKNYIFEFIPEDSEIYMDELGLWYLIMKGINKEARQRQIRYVDANYEDNLNNKYFVKGFIWTFIITIIMLCVEFNKERLKRIYKGYEKKHLDKKDIIKSHKRLLKSLKIK